MQLGRRKSPVNKDRGKHLPDYVPHPVTDFCPNNVPPDIFFRGAYHLRTSQGLLKTPVGDELVKTPSTPPFD